MSQSIPRKPKLINVCSDNWLQHSSLFINSHSRGFISESGVVFNFVQRASKCQELLSHSEMIKASRKYRSVIHSWYIRIIEELSNQQEQQNTQEPRLTDSQQTELLEQSNVLHKMEIAWHLCEILYINVSSTGTLLVQLLNWIKWHFTYYVELANKLILNDLPQMDPNYWDVIMFFALRGDMENASLFLELHSESKNDKMFIMVRDLLRKFPLLNNNVAIHEYFLRWGFWHDSVLQALNNQQIKQSNKRSYANLELLLKLLAGDLDSFKNVSHLFHSWYQMMVSYALFTNPCLKGDINGLIEKFINIFYQKNNQEPNMNSSNDDDGISNFDKLIRSAFNYDLIEVIKQSSMCFEDAWWFVTHFVDLIYNSSLYSDYQIADINLIRNSFVINYAESLFVRRRQFWQLSIEYLIHCKDSQQHILTCLERVPFDNEKELQRLLTTCRRFNFNDLECSLCRIQSRKWLKMAQQHKISSKQQYGSALFWAIRSKDKLLINHIVDQFLKNYLHSKRKNGIEEQAELTLLDEDLISNIGGSIVLSERLIFLCKYHEFHQLCREQQYNQAAKILVDMLVSNAIPDFFQFQVIQDCLPLIQSKELFMNCENTCKIISSLESLLYRMKMRHQKDSLKKTNNNIWSDYFGSTTNQDNELEETSNTHRKLIEQFEQKLRVVAAQNQSENFVIFHDEFNNCENYLNETTCKNMSIID